MATLTGWSDEEYLRATDLASDALNPPAIPAWVEMTAPADGWQRQAVLGCRGDERWRVLYALAGSLLRHGYPVALVAVLAQAWGNARCRPVPTWDDVARVVARVGEAAA